MRNFLNITLRIAAMATGGILLTAGVVSAAAVDVYLQAQSVTKTLPGPVSAPAWVFICTPGAPSNPNCISSPSGSPRINAAAGDNLTIHLTNTLPTAVSMVIPGQAGGGDPVMAPDSLGRNRVRSLTHETAAGTVASPITYTFNGLRPGTYLYQSGTRQPLQVPMGLYGALVVSGPTGVACAPLQQAAYSTVNSCYNADALVVFSEIDLVQNQRVATAVAASMQPGQTCVTLEAWTQSGTVGYPCTVDYSPTHFLINDEPYSKTTPPPALPAGAPGNSVLLRFVNAGLRSHTPTVVGLGIGLVAEDGNPYPGLVKQQSAALLPAGKTMDVLVAMPAVNATYPLLDRMLNLTNDNQPDGGMLAYLKVGTGSPPPVPASVFAVNDTYPVTEDTPLPGANVLANDVGLAGATVAVVSGPSNGTLTLNPTGTFTYTPNANFSGADGFTYKATLSGNSYPAQVVLNVSFVNDAPVAAADGPYVNTIGSGITVAAPGVLGNDADPDGNTLTAALVAPVPGLTLNANGSFTYTGGAPSVSFMYRASDGTSQSAPATVTLKVNPVANIALTVKDPDNVTVSAYRWLVQEDATFHINPAAPLPLTDTLSTNFHKSHMPVVAQGAGGAQFSQLALDPAKRYYVSVLPDDAGTGEGHSVGGAQILPGATAVTVLVNKQPIPTAQIAVFAFEDNSPTNGAPDAPEPGLGGFQITLVDAGGRYGMSGGTMSQDAFGNPLKNYQNCFGANTPPEGVILTCPDGTALIKNLPPGKYGIIVVPPPGSGTWTQTSTIEGTKQVDNWVKSGEPPFFVEFGQPGFHTFVGFVNPAHTTVPPGGSGSNTITGRVTMVHAARAPSTTAFDTGSYEALAHTRAWVGLNSIGGDGPNFATVQADPEGNFTMTGIPNGTYQLAIWDDYLDQIISYRTVTVPGGGNVGNVPVLPWFGRHEHNVFLDSNGNGRRDPGEQGLPDQNVNLRFRDGTVDQSYPTDTTGFVPFDQIFPYFSWQIAEIDYLRFKPTGVTVTVDGGGDVSGGPYPGLLNPQAGSPRTDTEPAPVLLQGFQSMAGSTSIFEWGKKPYEPGENGGIAGIVFYASTRGENDPRLTVGDPWEPGIPGVKVRLYREVATAAGGTTLALVQEVQTDSWDANTPTGCVAEPAGPAYNAFVGGTLGGDATRCYDGFRNYDQVRPGAVFDGGYAFTGIPPGKYIVEVVPPTGYELVKEEDKNVDFGDAFASAPAAMMLPGGALLAAMPDKAMVRAAMGAEPGIAQPPCVGPLHTVPNQLSLFPGVDTYAPFAGTQRPLCNRKLVELPDQGQAAADFHLFTSTPVAGQFAGISTDDIAMETSNASPSYGDKWGTAFQPISMRDFNGQEIYRTYTDAFGRYNGVVPSTFSANIPVPSGYSPAMHFVCLNDAGPLPDGSLDPLQDPNYGTFCYTMMYMPGTTTYLDTPVIPQAAFAAGFNPADCACTDGTPVVKQVNGTGIGPLVAPGGTLTIISQGLGVQVPNPAYEGPLTTAGAPFNQRTITRNFDFGSSGSVALIAGNGVSTPLTVGTWGSGTITRTIPAGMAAGAYQLVVTRADNGKSSVNTVTVTVGTEIPIRVGPGQLHKTIQSAIDAAPANALILVEPGRYQELVVMWKPVRLQGSGTVTHIEANKRLPEKLQTWRLKVESVLASGAVDLLPGQPAVFNIVGGGLLADELGAGITVLAKNNGSFLGTQARIDGFTISGADGGGGIFVNGYAHNLQIANNHITGNSGVLHGGIRVGHPSLPLTGDGPFQYNRNINIHHNSITRNGGQSDVGFGGGVALSTGTDNYVVSRNFICGNFNLGDGGGIAHMGLSTPGRIDFNQVLFNQVFNQGQNAHGGGILVAGEPTGALSLGAGNVTIDANLVQGNQAATGHGGGIRTQLVNGRDVQRSPINFTNWYRVAITNNTVVNNVAGWSGGGIALQDTANSAVVLNTIANNDTTATVGAVFNAGTNTSTRQPAGISSERHSVALDAVIPGNSQWRNFSNPLLTHNIIRHNRAFTYDSNPAVPVVRPQLSQATAGACPAGADYFDLGVLDPGFSMTPLYSILTNTSGITNLSADPLFTNRYCNGSRTLRTPGPIQVFSEVTEGGNFIDVRFGPLTQSWPAASAPWNYHLTSSSPAINPSIPLFIQPVVENSGHDIDNNTRPQGPRSDLGADEFTVAVVTTPTVAPTTLAFGNVVVGSSSALQTLTLTNAGTPLTGIGVTVTAPFSRQGGTCGTTLAANANCTILVRFNPTAAGGPSFTGTVTIAASLPVTGSPVGLTGARIAAPAKPTLTVLDNFNRANGGLGGNWTASLLQVNNNQAVCQIGGLCLLGSAANWNSGPAFTAKQGAAFTLASATINNDALVLDATGAVVAGVSTNFIRVRYNGGTVNVETTTNLGVNYSSAGTMASTFANGDTLTAVVDGTAAVAAPTVYVWRTTAANVTTFVGAIQIAPNALWQGGGRIGMQLPFNLGTPARVDNFAGGIVP